jgi:16S rRNA (guanine1516-N2)-methyltransferase
MTNLPLITVSSTSISETILQKARTQAEILCLPFTLTGTDNSRYILNYTDDHIELCINPAHAGSSNFSPVWVDFLHGNSAYRHAVNCTIKQPLAKAVGIKPGFRPNIFDATAGLGGDSFVLACLGCEVILNERSPIIGTLLSDGLERAANSPKTAEIVNSRMRLVISDSCDHLKRLDHKPHTIYLDPMYPHSGKTALNKKEMRMIREIVGDDCDGTELLETALYFAGNRVAVKRPKGAEHLGGIKPSHEIIMKNSRFDVYLTVHL